MGSAIFLTTVPATIITSAWRGDGHVTTPKRSRSWWDMWVLIISIAQHANPKLSVHSDDLRALAKRSRGLGCDGVGQYVVEDAICLAGCLSQADSPGRELSPLQDALSHP